MVDLSKIEENLQEVQNKIKEREENVPEILNKTLDDLQDEYNDKRINIEAEILRLEGIKKDTTLDEEKNAVDSFNQIANKNIAIQKKELESIKSEFEDRKKQLEDNENDYEKIVELKSEMIQGIKENRKEVEEAEQQKEDVVNEEWEKFKNTLNTIINTQKVIEDYKKAEKCLIKSPEVKKQVFTARKAEQEKLKTLIETRREIWAKYYKEIDELEETKKEKEKVWKETQVLIDRYDLALEIEKPDEVLEQEELEQEEQEEVEEENAGPELSENEPKEEVFTNVKFTEESVNNLIEIYRRNIEEFFESKGIDVTQSDIKKYLDNAIEDKKNLMLEHISDENYFNEGRTEFFIVRGILKSNNKQIVEDTLEEIMSELDDQIRLLDGNDKIKAIDEYNKLVKEAEKLDLKLVYKEIKQDQASVKPEKPQPENEPKTTSERPIIPQPVNRTASEGPVIPQPVSQSRKTSEQSARTSTESEQEEDVNENVNENEETLPIEISAITCFAKAGFYQVVFSDNTAVGISQLYHMVDDEGYHISEHYKTRAEKMLLETIKSALEKKGNLEKIEDIDKYIESSKHKLEKGDLKVIYDNMTKLSKIKEIHESKSLNKNSDLIRKPTRENKRIMNEILKEARDVDGAIIRGGVGAIGKIKYFLASKVFHRNDPKYVSAAKNAKQLGEAVSKIKTPETWKRQREQEENNKQLKATKEQIAEANRIGIEAGKAQEAQQSSPDRQMSEQQGQAKAKEDAEMEALMKFLDEENEKRQGKDKGSEIGD